MDNQGLSIGLFFKMVYQFFQDPAAVVIFIIFTAVFVFFVLIMTNKQFAEYIMGIIPGQGPRDEKGNPVPRTPGQNIGMGIFILVLAILIYFALQY